MAVYNEVDTAAASIERVLGVDIPDVDVELIVIESNSSDGTREVVSRYVADPRVRPGPAGRPEGQGRRRARGVRARDRRDHPHPGRRSGVLGRRLPEAHRADNGREGRCDARVPPRPGTRSLELWTSSLFVALDRQRGALGVHRVLQRHVRNEAARPLHDVQGLPERVHRGRGVRRGPVDFDGNLPPSSSGWGTSQSRSRSSTTRAPSTRARKSASSRTRPTWIAACLRFRFGSVSPIPLPCGNVKRSPPVPPQRPAGGPAPWDTPTGARQRCGAGQPPRRSSARARGLAQPSLRDIARDRERALVGGRGYVPNVASEPGLPRRIGRVPLFNLVGAARVVPHRRHRLLACPLRRSHAQPFHTGTAGYKRLRALTRLAPGRGLPGRVPGGPVGASSWAFEPWAEVTHRIYANGEMPLGNPYQAAGAPHAANMQSAVFDLLLLAVNLHPTPLTWALSIIGAFLLGAPRLRVRPRPRRPCGSGGRHEHGVLPQRLVLPLRQQGLRPLVCLPAAAVPPRRARAALPTTAARPRAGRCRGGKHLCRHARGLAARARQHRRLCGRAARAGAHAHAAPHFARPSGRRPACGAWRSPPRSSSSSSEYEPLSFNLHKPEAARGTHDGAAMGTAQLVATVLLGATLRGPWCRASGTGSVSGSGSPPSPRCRGEWRRGGCMHGCSSPSGVRSSSRSTSSGCPTGSGSCRSSS